MELVRRLIAAIRENDEHQVEEAVLQLAGTRKIFAPLALAVGAFVMLFSGLRLLVTNWRLMLVQALPAMWIWAATYDLKAKVLRGQPFHDIRGPIVLVLFAAVVLITIAAFYLNAAFAFAISQPGPPDLRAGFGQARKHVRTVTGWGTGVGLALAVATMLAPRWGLGWFALLLGIVLAVMMVCYVAVPARIVGIRTARPAGTAQSGRVAKLAAAAVTGLFGAIVCTPTMPKTDRGTGRPPESAYRLPEDGPLPDLPLYERLIDDGIAAADAQDRPVDHLTARRLAIWLAARPQPSVFAQSVVHFVNTGAVNPALKTHLRIHARSGNYPDRPEAARLMQYCVARGAGLGPIGENFGTACDQIDRADAMLAACYQRARHSCGQPEQGRLWPAGPRRSCQVGAAAGHRTWQHLR